MTMIKLRQSLKADYRAKELLRQSIQADTEQYIESLQGGRGLFISDHAIVRYLERVKGWTFRTETDKSKLNEYCGYLGKIREEMLTLDEDREILTSQKTTFRKGNCLYVIKELAIVTVLSIKE